MTRIDAAWLDDDEPDKEKKENEGMKPEQPMAPVQMALFRARTVLIFGEIDMIINSPGGHVESGDTIHDMIRFCGPKVKIIGTGWVASAGAHIFLGAEKEN